MGKWGLEGVEGKHEMQGDCLCRAFLESSTLGPEHLGWSVLVGPGRAQHHVGVCCEAQARKDHNELCQK